MKRLLLSILFIPSFFVCSAQKAPEKTWSSSRILHEIEKLKHVGRVLYIAAHPDDENTQLIAYLANVKGIDVAYMSLTRGDGGQDLIGPEVRDELGVIRTQELLMARSVDGGQQFFSRANDFGFSKTAKETLHIWDSNEVLSDIVWKIRTFKPDIIITRFSPTYNKTHGHHTASAILAQRAFDDAANPTKFPKQLKYTGTWQAKSLFWNTSLFFFNDANPDTSQMYHTNIGAYIPLLGKSVGELAAESRTMHKSQGMGSSPRRGDIMEYFVYMKGEKPKDRDIFSDYNWDWGHIENCDCGFVNADVDKIIANYDMLHPEKSVDALIALFRRLDFPIQYGKIVPSKMEQIEDIILQCEGVYAEAISTKKFLSVGDSINVGVNIIDQNNELSIESDSLEIDGKTITSIAKTAPFIPINGPLNNIPLRKNDFRTITLSSYIPETTKITGPYWLEDEHTVGMYKVDDQRMRGLPQNPPQVVVHIIYAIGSISIEKDLPVFYKTTDPSKGDVYSLARIVPPAVAIPQEKLLVFADSNPKEITLKIKSFKKDAVTVRLDPPPGWGLGFEEDSDGFRGDSSGLSSLIQDTDMQGGGSELTLSFKVFPPEYVSTCLINPKIFVNGVSYDRSFEDINYDHIPEQILLPKSQIKVERIDIITHPKLVGYINGAGDDVPASLKEMGYKVEIISPNQIATANLSKYDAIIAGIRAYNTITELKYDNAKLLEYVKNGGNYIVQYNTIYPKLVTDSIGPYYLHVANVRTTEEDCKITFLNTNNPVLNTPNKITQKDFEGWVQERGLYYPDKWDTAHYIPLLEMNDTGEPPTKGALLVTQYGKGNFVYTGLVFFRELPAGVPGAYRLMANLIELEKH